MWTCPICQVRIEGPSGKLVSSRRSHHLESAHPDLTPERCQVTNPLWTFLLLAMRSPCILGLSRVRFAKKASLMELAGIPKKSPLRLTSRPNTHVGRSRLGLLLRLDLSSTKKTRSSSRATRLGPLPGLKLTRSKRLQSIPPRKPVTSSDSSLRTGPRGLPRQVSPTGGEETFGLARSVLGFLRVATFTTSAKSGAAPSCRAAKQPLRFVSGNVCRTALQTGTCSLAFGPK